MANPNNNSDSNTWGGASEWKSPLPGSGWGDLKSPEAQPLNTLALPPASVSVLPPDPKDAKIIAAEETWNRYYQKQPSSLAAIPWRPHWDSLTRDPPRYCRGDMTEVEWSWNGAEDRDTTLDNLPDEDWGPTQLHRCLPTARKQGCPPPTFTGAQVMERLRRVAKEFEALEVEVEKVHRERKELEERAQEFDRKAQECRSRSLDLEEKVGALDSSKRRVNEIMQDLKDLQAIGLCFARA
ncbi:hypothetical protein V5O48_009411 [Marasmius crinis-equi]|uniref:Uncharacterized protein n=1 Tax=Marasmius crinis-equi TaxID=585013 RepID=A0ABR3FBR3_9AGAR